MNILEEANKITSTIKREEYGSPRENVNRIRQIASAILGRELTNDDIMAVMLSVKLSRQMHQHKRDNLVDIAGYAWVWSQMYTEE